MKAVLKRLLFVLALWCQLGFAEIHDLVQLEKDLRQRVENSNGDNWQAPEVILPILEKHQAGITKDAGTLAKMTQEDSYPMVVIAGIVGLNEIDPSAAFEVSLIHLWQTPALGSVMNVPFFGCVTNEVSTITFQSALSSAATTKPASYINVAFTLGKLPAKPLFEWLMSPNRPVVPISMEAMVIEALHHRRDELPEGQQQELQKRLIRLADYPGLPRCIYFVNSGADTSESFDAIVTLLNDSDIHRFLKLQLAKAVADTLHGRITDDLLKIDPQDITQIQRAIEKYSKKGQAK